MNEKPKTELHFTVTVSRIVNFEKRTGYSLLTAFSGAGASLTAVIELIKELTGADDETIDNYVAENGFEKLTDVMTEALIDSGFLPKEKAEAEKKA